MFVYDIVYVVAVVVVDVVVCGNAGAVVHVLAELVVNYVVDVVVMLL